VLYIILVEFGITMKLVGIIKNLNEAYSKVCTGRNLDTFPV
jgi:hypothetical protein